MNPVTTDIIAEKAVIVSILSDAEAANTAVTSLTMEDFADPICRRLFAVAKNIVEGGRTPDVVSVHSFMLGRPEYADICDVEFLKTILLEDVMYSNISSYIQNVMNMSTKRKVINILKAKFADCMNAEIEAEDTIDSLVNELLQIRLQGSTELVPIEKIVLNVINTIEAASKADGALTGVAAGFSRLDFMTSGFQKSDFIIIAARPSMGKTSFALNIVKHVVLQEHLSTAVFSLEMSKEQCVTRLLSMISGINSTKLKTGKLLQDEWGFIGEQAGSLSKTPLVIDDTPAISISELRAKCQKIKAQNGLDLVIIDYLQLMSGPAKRSESRLQEISAISRNLKALARELNVPIIALSQLSRAPEQRADHRPMLSDLRESGSIEQDADMVMLLYRDDYYNKESSMQGRTELILAKNRNGPTGTVQLAWIPSTTSFYTLEL